MDVCDLGDDSYGYAYLSTLLAERATGPYSVAIAADRGDRLVPMLLITAGWALTVVDDESTDEFAERFTDELPEDAEPAPTQRRALGLARALQAGALSASLLAPPADLAGLKPVLAAHSALAIGRQAAAVALREVLRELYPAALRAYPDPADPVALAVMDALPEPGALASSSAGRGRDAAATADAVTARLAAAGVADQAAVAEAITALRVAIAETPRRGGLNRALTGTVAEAVRQSVAAVRACDAASTVLVNALAERVVPARTAPAPAPAPTPPASAPVAAPASPAHLAAASPAHLAASASPAHLAAPASPTHLAAPASPPPIAAPASPTHLAAPASPPPIAAPASPTPVVAPAPPPARFAVPPVPTPPIPAPVAAPAARPPAGTPLPPGRPAPAPFVPRPTQPAAPAPRPEAPVPVDAFAPPVSLAAVPVPPRSPAPPAGRTVPPPTIRPAVPAHRATGSPVPPVPSAPPARSERAAPANRPMSAPPPPPPGITPIAEPPRPAPDRWPADELDPGRQMIPVPAPRPSPERAARNSRADWPTSPPPSPPGAPWAALWAAPAAAPPAPAPAAPPPERPGTVTPPWRADDLKVPELPNLRLVEPSFPEELRDDFGYSSPRPEPPPLRLVEPSGNGIPRSAPPVSADDDNDLLIFAQTRSAWFDQEPTGAWESEMDAGWRAAEQAARPAVGQRTGAGLPRRVPHANLVPGAPPRRDDRPLRVVRDPASIAEHTSGYFSGWRRGQEVGGYPLGGRPGRQSAGAWEFHRDEDRLSS
jgi:hypothetical protein